MTDARKCCTVKDVALLTGMSPQHIHRLTKNKVIELNEMECHTTASGIVIYNDTALEKFIEYSKENHRGRKKKETTENTES